MSAGRSSFETNVFITKNNSSRLVSFEDDMSQDFSTSRPYPYSTPSERATALPTRKRKSTAIRAQVPPQHEPSALEKDARKAVGAILQRVGTAAARANRSLVVVLQMRDALRKDNSKKTRAAQEAAKWKKTKGMAYDTLKLARAEESAVKKQYKGCSRPRRVLRYIMAGWESEVEKAARLADEADRVYRLSRAEAGAAREVACRCAQEEEATELFLRRAELAHASAVKIFHALEAAAARAEDRAVYAVNAVGVGRCWAKEVYARGGGDKIDPLLVAAELAASVEDGFTDDQMQLQQVAPKAKKLRH